MAFYQSEIREIILPEGVKSLRYFCFAKCKHIDQLTIPKSIEEIDTSVFDSSKIKVLTLNTTTVKNNWFGGCEVLELNIMNGLKLFGDSAFRLGVVHSVNWNSQEKIITTLVPLWMKKKLKDQVECVNFCLSRNDVDENDGILDGETMYVPEGCLRLEECCINHKKIKSIKFPSPNTVKSFGSFAFDECNNLKELNIPEGVEELEEICFNRCKQLESVRFPESIKKLGKDIFYYCPAMKYVLIPSSRKNFFEEYFKSSGYTFIPY